MRELLGGKGANLAEMTHVLGPDLIPPGFTITTEACVAYLNARSRLPEGVAEELVTALARLEQRAERKFDDPTDPLLVSVRSGARESMPGMLDTVLNVGLNERTVEALARRTGDERFAWDSYRRLAQMFGTVVRGVAGESFEEILATARASFGVSSDSDLDTGALQQLTRAFTQLYEFPQDPRQQFQEAIGAVFESWRSERAIHYRRIHQIPDSWGTAVTIQQMVFGNRGQGSGSGVAFSRNESTGAPPPSGDFLVNAQGEDVVSGARTPLDLAELATMQPEVHGELVEILRLLEQHYGDMQDVEFTIEEGRLFILQARPAKRPGQAAVRFAVDAVSEGLLDLEQALLTIDPDAVAGLLHRRFDPNASYRVLARGVAASPGAARGKIALSAEIAAEWATDGRDVILARSFTDAADIAGFHAAKGIVTNEGGKSSHAALIARGMGRPAITGVGTIEFDLKARQLRIGDSVLGEGDTIAIDGTSGEITDDDVPLVDLERSQELEEVLRWSDEIREIEVRANADTAAAVGDALALGAAGVGLCRTEHMLLGPRQKLISAVILAVDDSARDEAIARLAQVHQRDFEEILRAARGRPVCVRLLDPPLHEFLPRPAELPVGSAGRARIEELQETNPMLGTRGVRLGVLLPELYEMQARAVFRAAARVTDSEVEVLIPLVAYEREFRLMREIIDRVAREEGVGNCVVGTMIELPRACFIADRIAEDADFFSFGTNDLTQTGLGFSRDDIEATILSRYVETGIVDSSPFQTIDRAGIGQMIRMGAWLGRTAKPSLKLGVCGEHAGDPASIDFFTTSGFDYLSCSPYRLPIARLAAAQATIRRQDPSEDLSGRA